MRSGWIAERISRLNLSMKSQSGMGHPWAIDYARAKIMRSIPFNAAAGQVGELQFAGVRYFLAVRKKRWSETCKQFLRNISDDLPPASRALGA